MRLAAAAIARTEPLAEGGRGSHRQHRVHRRYEGQIGQLPYAAAKGGVLGMTLVAARDLSPLGIPGQHIAPGTINTPPTARRPICWSSTGARRCRSRSGWGARPNTRSWPRASSRTTTSTARSSARRALRFPPSEPARQDAFVAGASRGIGATVAQALARAGAAVAVAARSEEPASCPAPSGRGRDHHRRGRHRASGPCDVTDEESGKLRWPRRFPNSAGSTSWSPTPACCGSAPSSRPRSNAGSAASTST